MRENKLIYKEQAKYWNEGLPIGNGKIGAMLCEEGNTDVYYLNEETIWSGANQRNWNNSEVPKILPSIRDAINEGDYEEATDLCYAIQGVYNESYLPLGTLSILHNHLNEEGVGDYRRELDLKTAVYNATCRSSKGVLKKEAFASHPKNCLFFRYEMEGELKLDLTVRLQSQLKGYVRAYDKKGVLLHGECPSHLERDHLDVKNTIVYDEKNPGISFNSKIQVLKTDGVIREDDFGLQVKEATFVEFVFSTVSNFDGSDVKPKDSTVDYAKKLDELIHRALKTTYESARIEHIKDFSSLFNRVNLELPELGAHETTLDQIKDYNTSEDPGLVEKTFHYGRYLLISSSRSGSLPANLQGIWNHVMRPPWMCNWTMDLNIQMSYWLTWMCNLPECETPFLEFIDGLRKNGRETAKVNYKAKGWVCHNTVDIWMQTGPAGIEEPRWSVLPLGGVWACHHLWMHYKYHGNDEYLKDFAYPIMKEAAEFCLDWLVEDDDGYWVTSPSVSPENPFHYEGNKVGHVSKACTYDIILIKDLFQNIIQATKILSLDDTFSQQLVKTMENMYDFKIGRYGQLQEWSEDWDDLDDTHRHIAHLVGLHPMSQFTKNKNEELWDSCRKSLEIRCGDYSKKMMDKDTGWSLSWKISWWARLFDKGRIEEMLKALFNPVAPDYVQTGAPYGGIYPNLTVACPPFMIEACLGFVAGVCEMIVQSHDDEIRILPAVLDSWGDGKMEGIKVQGGHILDICWKKNGEVTVVIHPGSNEKTRLCYGDTSMDLELCSEMESIGYFYDPVIGKWSEFANADNIAL